MRFAVGIEYDGSGFFGWQTQREEPTVQATLERALARVADHPVSLVCAGRTDTGVHARCQVAHFDTQATRSERSWVLGVNANLPPTVCLRWIQPVDEGFHARFTAFARTYEYVVLNRWVRPAIEAARVCWQRRPLDAAAMDQAARVLLGEHDFSAFRSSGCKANHPVRTIHELRVRREGDRVRISVTANAFLYHMVRNLAGTLMEVGTGNRPPGWVAEVLAGRDRTRAGITAPAEGLYFVAVRYPERYGLPLEPSAFPELDSQ